MNTMVMLGNTITMVDSYSMRDIDVKVIHVIDDETVIVLDDMDVPFKAMYDDVDGYWNLLD